MQAVKRKLGGGAAFGEVPNSMLHAGTVEQVTACIKELMDTVAVDGGYGMAAGAVVAEARPENLRAMFETSKTYGVYR